MTIADYVTFIVISVLIIIAIWLNIRILVVDSPPKWRFVSGVSGVLFVAVSAFIFVKMRLAFARTPSTVGNLDLALTVLRRYTRFKPESLALGGIALGLAGVRKARWAVVVAGVLMAVWWYLFAVSFV